MNNDHTHGDIIGWLIGLVVCVAMLLAVLLFSTTDRLDWLEAQFTPTPEATSEMPNREPMTK